jgi:alpha-L-rhamnosidase
MYYFKRLALISLLSVLVLDVCSQQQHPLVTAQWIRGRYSDHHDALPCPVFKKTFAAKGKIRSATAYITSHGIYEASINGQRVGNALFTPGYTYYPKRLQYQRYDVTEYLQKENTFRITVGQGWWNWHYRKDSAAPAILTAIRLTYADGSIETIVSDSTWEVSESNIRYSSIYHGETIDHHAMEAFQPVHIADYSKDQLVPTMGAPVSRHETFRPKHIIGDSIIDFGQNMAGWIRFSVNGHQGDSVIIRFAEQLQPDGSLFTRPLRGARATDRFILRGDRTETFEPHFTYHGFRYAHVIYKRGADTLRNPGLQHWNISAVALYSDLKRTGSFSCSDPRLNQLQHNIEWSMKSNFFDIPTDCPQRDERLGWTEDAEVFCPTACFLMDVKDFYRKWLADLAAGQQANGRVPATAPAIRYTMDCAGWSDAATFTPWTLYERYGDTSILSDQYPSMKKWVDYVTSQSKNDLWTANGFGDWYPAGPKTPLPYLDQCFWYRSAEIVANTAKILGKKNDEERYRLLAARIKKAFNENYLDSIPSTQTAYVIGIAFGLLPDSAIHQLAQLIKKNNNQLATGFMGTPRLLQVLSQHGYADLAYTLLLQERMPSWLYMVNKGATTLWEKWNGIEADGSLHSSGDISYNHYAFGSVGNWMYENIGGIKPVSPGYKTIAIQPLIGGGLTWVKASYLCSFGKIVSEWKVKHGRFRLYVEIPDQTTATVHLPDHTMREVGPGKYRFNVPFLNPQL